METQRPASNGRIWGDVYERLLDLVSYGSEGAELALQAFSQSIPNRDDPEAQRRDSLDRMEKLASDLDEAFGARDCLNEAFQLAIHYSRKDK